MSVSFSDIEVGDIVVLTKNNGDRRLVITMSG